MPAIVGAMLIYLFSLVMIFIPALSSPEWTIVLIGIVGILSPRLLFALL